jgi:hypothetical protein
VLGYFGFDPTIYGNNQIDNKRRKWRDDLRDERRRGYCNLVQSFQQKFNGIDTCGLYDCLCHKWGVRIMEVH